MAQQTQNNIYNQYKIFPVGILPEEIQKTCGYDPTKRYNGLFVEALRPEYKNFIIRFGPDNIEVMDDGKLNVQFVVVNVPSTVTQSTLSNIVETKDFQDYVGLIITDIITRSVEKEIENENTRNTDLRESD